jgi:hypothetical protein
VHKPGAEPKQYRIFVLVSRQALLDSRFSNCNLRIGVQPRRRIGDSASSGHRARAETSKLDYV